MVEKKYDDFRDLEVWQRCREIQNRIWTLCKGFPAEKKFRLSDPAIPQ